MKFCLSPPEFHDPEQARVARYLHYLLLIGLPTVIALLGFYLGFSQDEERFQAAISCAVMLLVCLILLRLLYLGKLRIVSLVLIIAGTTVVFVAISQSGIRDAAVNALLLMLVLTSVLLGGRATIVFGVVLMLALPGAYIAEVTRILIGNYLGLPDLSTLLITLLSIIITTVFLYLTIEKIVKNSNHIRQQAAILRENNIQLHKIRASLEERTQELSMLNENLRNTQAQLIESEKMASLGGLIAGVAREINTPVGIGVTAASTLAEEVELFVAKYEVGSIKRADLEMLLTIAEQSSGLILGNLQRSAELVQSFKQIAVDQVYQDKRRFTVKPYIEETLSSLNPHLKETSHSMTVIGDHTISIESYPGDLSQIIANLVLNSIMHGYPDNRAGCLQFELTQNGSWLQILYSDNGDGISPENIDKIFEPFYTTARTQGGTGLGLYIVYILVTQRLGGTIQCESQVGQGTQFIVNLPL